MLGQNDKKDNKFHCHLLQQHARLETRGPSTTLLNTTWTPCGPFAHVPFIIINAKRGVGSTLEGLLLWNWAESGSTSGPHRVHTGPHWREPYCETHSRVGPHRVHTGQKAFCEEPLPIMYWGFVGLKGRLLNKCLSFQPSTPKSKFQLNF